MLEPNMEFKDSRKPKKFEQRDWNVSFTRNLITMMVFRDLIRPGLLALCPVRPMLKAASAASVWAYNELLRLTCISADCDLKHDFDCCTVFESDPGLDALKLRVDAVGPGRQTPPRLYDQPGAAQPWPPIAKDAPLLSCILKLFQIEGLEHQAGADRVLLRISVANAMAKSANGSSTCSFRSTARAVCADLNSHWPRSGSDLIPSDRELNLDQRATTAPC
ncbi:hypothetical protein EVAR_43835_1 [Eumeta japonica]|uniref:Uncharacterized protein n=1 Tax=Eumeta variegata TaxID=151549 RepID=A0A4C1WZD5_EUMVA|nr:hypothetical protein EVAR_43835_1 [Eumeta japonica]